jgi:hypothetical protein
LGFIGTAAGTKNKIKTKLLRSRLQLAEFCSGFDMKIAAPASSMRPGISSMKNYEEMRVASQATIGSFTFKVIASGCEATAQVAIQIEKKYSTAVPVDEAIP